MVTPSSHPPGWTEERAVERRFHRPASLLITDYEDQSGLNL